MSIVGSESVFLSALQPNTSVTTYGLPSEIHLGNGGTMSDEMTRARRVQQQVQMRLAEKSTLPRQNGSSSHYAMSGKHQQVFFVVFNKCLHLLRHDSCLCPCTEHRNDLNRNDLCSARDWQSSNTSVSPQEQKQVHGSDTKTLKTDLLTVLQTRNGSSYLIRQTCFVSFSLTPNY